MYTEVSALLTRKGEAAGRVQTHRFTGCYLSQLSTSCTDLASAYKPPPIKHQGWRTPALPLDTDKGGGSTLEGPFWPSSCCSLPHRVCSLHSQRSMDPRARDLHS